MDSCNYNGVFFEELDKNKIIRSKNSNKEAFKMKKCICEK